MGKLLLVVSAFTIFQISIVLQIAQLICWPLDWIGLRSVRLAITGTVANAVGHSIIFWFEYMTSISVVITGDELPPNERVLVISNHINSEWMHIMSLVHRNTKVGGFKAVMKEALKWVPVANCGIREGFVTVKRGGGKEARMSILKSFTKQGRRLASDRVPLWLVIFPEGTWITPNDLAVKEKANEFAKKEGYKKPLNNVLYPVKKNFLAR